MKLNSKQLLGSIKIILQPAVFAVIIGCLPAPLFAAAPRSGGAIQPQFDTAPPPKDAGSFYNIPAVIDRPLSVDAGDKIKVTRFEIEGALDHPENNLFKKDLVVLLESARQSHPDGMTVGQLQEAANLIRDAYRQAGFPVAQAFIPAQDVNDGVLKVSVMEGVLGDIVVEKSMLYREKWVKRGAAGLVGKPAQAQSLESALLTVNDYPGLDVLGVLRPGKNMGETELVLTAQKETPYQYFLNVDNHGSKFSGQSRVFGGFTANNPLGIADRLDIVALQTIDPSDSLYGLINYEVQTPWPTLRAGVGFNDNAYSVGEEFSDVALEGSTTQLDGYLLQQWVRGRTLSMSSRFNLASKQDELNEDLTKERINRDELTVASASLDVDFLDAIFHGSNRIGLKYSRGFEEVMGSMDENGMTGNEMFSSRQGGDGTYASGKFEKLNLDYIRIQAMPFKSDLELRFSGQATNDMLVGLEAFSLGGPYSVRAYPVGEALFDNGWFASAEWFFPAPFFAEKDAFAGRRWGDVFRVSVFVDYAGGTDINPTEDDKESGMNTMELSGVGIGMELRLADAFFIKTEAATPIGSYDATDERNPQYWLSAGLEF